MVRLIMFCVLEQAGTDRRLQVRYGKELPHIAGEFSKEPLIETGSNPETL